MKINLNEFLLSISTVLDFVDSESLNVNKNHAKRAAYMAIKIAQEIGLSSEEIFDLASLAILHDIGSIVADTKSVLLDEIEVNNNSLKRMKEYKLEHVYIGEENLKIYPFLTDVKGVILYHHEHYDGSGFFKLKGEEIPLLSQIIRIVDVLDVKFDYNDLTLENKDNIYSYLKDNSGTMFSEKLVDAFTKASRNLAFWLDLLDNNLERALYKNIPKLSVDITLKQLFKITSIYCNIIDLKCEFSHSHSMGITHKTEIMCDYYKKDENEKYKLMIAASLHDLGKLAISGNIINKPNKLELSEYEIAKSHVYYTREALERIQGFEDIVEWASNHHEKLNGTGYPYGLVADELDFNSRLISVIDIYQSVTERRPYRVGVSHKEAMKILKKMVDK